jgi:hypothetical protein
LLDRTGLLKLAVVITYLGLILTEQEATVDGQINDCYQEGLTGAAWCAFSLELCVHGDIINGFNRDVSLRVSVVTSWSLTRALSEQSFRFPLPVANPHPGPQCQTHIQPCCPSEEAHSSHNSVLPPMLVFTNSQKDLDLARSPS